MSKKQSPKERLFSGIFPSGIGYADRTKEEAGDYKKLAFLFFGDLKLEVEKDCPSEMEALIREDAAAIQARRGEQYRVSGSGQTITLGYNLPE